MEAAEYCPAYILTPDELIFGKNAVLSFLEQEAEKGAGGKVKINKIMIAQQAGGDGKLKRIAELSRQLKIPFYPCERRKLDQLCPDDRRHQGVVAVVSSAEMWSLSGFLQELEDNQTSLPVQDSCLVAIADGIEDPHNLGAIIRSAEAAGVKGLIIAQRRAAGLSSTVARTSAGAVANLPVVRAANLVQAIETLKQHGFWVVGLDAAASQNYTQADLKRKLAVVIGSEGSGISRLVRQHCDFLLKIPMLGKTQSLNASVAAGIIFYEVLRQNQDRVKPRH